MTSGSALLDVEVLMMAGGGGANFGVVFGRPADDDSNVYGGPGAGAGGLYIYSAKLDPGNYSLTVGGGGTNLALNGSNTTFTGASNAIGGGGRPSVPRGSLSNGTSGGSGSGGYLGGTGGSATSGQGNSGGTGQGACGGGGKGSAGSTAVNGAGGAGGSGYDLATFRGGSSLTVAFGGGGSWGSSNATNGDGTTTTSPASNTGGGAKPFQYTNGTGGSGRVIVRYQGSTQKATGGTVTTATVSGTTYTIHDFTAGGTFTVS